MGYNMPPRQYYIEDKFYPLAEKILVKEGFRNIVRMPRLSLYDCEAEKNGEKVYIEIKIRTPDKSPLFVMKKNKLKRLEELEKNSKHKVYLLFMWGERYRLMELSEFPKDLKPFKIFVTGKVYSYRMPLTMEVSEEERKKIIELYRQGYSIKKIAIMLNRSEVTVSKYIPAELKIERQKNAVKQKTAEKETKTLHIRCTKETKEKWHKTYKKFYYLYDFTADRVLSLALDYLNKYYSRGEVF